MMLDVMEQLEPDEAVLYLGGTFNDPALETGGRRAAGRGPRRPRQAARPHPAAGAAALPGGGRRRLGAVAAGPPVQPPDGPDQAARGHDRWASPRWSATCRGAASSCASRSAGSPWSRAPKATCGGFGASSMNRHALPEMGARGRRAVERRYCWEAVQGDLVDFYGSPHRKGEASREHRTLRQRARPGAAHRRRRVRLRRHHGAPHRERRQGHLRRLQHRRQERPGGLPQGRAQARGARRDRRPRHPRGGPQGLRLRGPHLPDHASGHPRGDDRPPARARPGLRAAAGAHRPPPGPQDHRRGGPARLQAHHGDGLRDPVEQPQLLAAGLRAARGAPHREEGARPWRATPARATATT